MNKYIESLKERIIAWVDERDKLHVVPLLDDLENAIHEQSFDIGYDPARYEILKDLIERYFFDVDGDNEKAIRQGLAMSDYIKIFKGQVQDNNLWHNQNILEWSYMNVAVKVGDSGDFMYKKLMDKDKIDPVVASTMALPVMILDKAN